MNTHKLIFRFILGTNKIRKDGKAPLFGRITYLGKRKQFSTSLYLYPKDWKSKLQEAHPPDKYSFINTQLSLISQKINEAFLFLQVNYSGFDVTDIFKKYNGEHVTKDITLLEAYDIHNNKMKKLIGRDLNEVSWSRYVENKRKVELFIRKTYKKQDIKLKTLDLKFIKDLEYYFKIDLKLRQATINRSIQRVRKIILFAMSQNLIDKDPFALYKSTKYKVNIVYLSQEELKKLEHHTFAQKRLEQVRDCFIFCCYTGLAYTEMSNLTEENLVIGFDSKIWIKMIRQKTNDMISVPLLNIAKRILDKYGGKLPIISNQKFNSYLKEIAVIVGIDKKLTHHVARKTFATTVLLYNDVPMEIVSELLGHSKIAVTQEHYAKVVKNKVSEELERLDKKLKGSS